MFCAGLIDLGILKNSTLGSFRHESCHHAFVVDNRLPIQSNERKVMIYGSRKRVLFALSFMVVTLLVDGCGSSSSLTAQEAERLITNGKGYLERKSLYYYVNGDTPLAQEAKKFMAEGRKSEMKGRYEDVKCQYSDCSRMKIYPYFIEKTVKEVKEILVDEKGYAQVAFVAQYGPTEYFTELENENPSYYKNLKEAFGGTVDERISSYNDKAQNSQEVAVQKKWEQGWRLMK